MSATSPSSRNMKRRVTGSSAETSEATKFSSTPEADDHRATFARQDDALGFGFADHRQRVGAFEFGHRGAHGLEQILLRLHVVVHAMRDHLGIRFGGEVVAELLELVAQLFVILDDAVVHDGEAVVRDMGVRVALGGHAVRGPARVGDAHLAVRGVRSIASWSIFTLPTVRRRLRCAVPFSTAMPAES